MEDLKMKNPIIQTALLFFTFCLLSSFSQAQWQWQNPLPQGNRLNDFAFINENDGWCVGDNGTIMHTSDGGANWGIQYDNYYISLHSICFADHLNGWIVGRNGSGFNTDCVILHTVDGGSTWTEQVNIIHNNLCDVFFANSDTGWVVGSSGVWGDYGSILTS